MGDEGAGKDDIPMGGAVGIRVGAEMAGAKEGDRVQYI
jgi:hypothetical protein